MKTLFIFLIALCSSSSAFAAKPKAMSTEVTRGISERIITDHSLSMNAQHVKVSSENGKVVLTGFVSSTAEKQKIESIAKGVAGNTPVVNNTTVMKQ